MKIDVLILYEHINRELESALFLQKVLEERGYTAHVAHVGWDEGPAKIQYQTRLIVTPWCYDGKDIRTICNYKSCAPSGKLKLLNIHCEQITSDEAMKFLLPAGEAKDIYHIAWGEFFKEQLMSVGVKEERICVAGSSRLDFFRRECSAISKSREELAKEFSLDESRKWVLLVGNFSAAFCSEETIANLEGRGYSNIRAQVDIAKRTYPEVLNWYDAILEQFSESNMEFIYRPHPSELMSDQLKALEEKYENFRVIRDYSIRDWFVTCDVAFSWNSTSAVEAASAEIPTYALRPVHIPEDLAFPILESVEQIVDLEQFKAAIVASLENRNSHVNDKFRSEIGYYYATGEKLATDLTADFIEKILADDGAADVDSYYSTTLAVRKCINYGIKILGYKWNLMPKHEKYKILRNEYITKDRYNSYVEKVRRIRG